MADQPSRAILARVRKLALLPEEVKQSRWAVSVTRLTLLKSLCQEAEVANRFMTYLARKTLQRVQQGKGRSSHPDTDEQRVHQELMTDALAEMEAWLQEPADDRRQRLRDLLHRMQERQNEHEHGQWGVVRVIRDWELLLFEYALHGLLDSAREAPYWAYQTARHYAERYTSSEGTGLTSSSVPLVEDIADFWLQEFDLDPAFIVAPRPKEKKDVATPTRSAKLALDKPKKAQFTPRQGQFLTFIHLYRKLHRRGPAETDLVKFFRATPPAVHGMIVKLEEMGLITREAGVPRSARVSVPEAELPPLQDVEGPSW